MMIVKTVIIAFAVITNFPFCEFSKLNGNLYLKIQGIKYILN